MKFGHIEIFVSDPAAARAFYEGVLGMSVTSVQGDGRYVWVEGHGATFLLRSPREAGSPSSYQAAPTGFVIYTDDLDATAAELRDRGLAFHGTDGSDACLTFHDPDGNFFQLVDPGAH